MMTVRHRIPSTSTDPKSGSRLDLQSGSKSDLPCNPKQNKSEYLRDCNITAKYTNFRQTSSLILPLLSIPLFICILYTLMHYMLYFDLNKRVYNHVPGECSYLPGGKTGATDIHFVDNITLIASTGTYLRNVSNSTGGILFWRLNEHESRLMTLKGSNGQKLKSTFNPYGISFAHAIIMTVNLRRPVHNTDTVELLMPDGEALKRVRKPVKSNLFTSLCDVHALDSKRFYVTNSYKYRRSSLQLAEFTLHSGTGSLLYFDGETVKEVLTGLRVPTGLAMQGNLLYISILGLDKIHVYKVGTTPSDLKLQEVIQVFATPHFFHIEAGSQALIVATHPNKLKYILHEYWPHDYMAPSQVLRLRKGKKGSWQITQLYANDGATISGSTVAARLDDRIVIGSVGDGLLRCSLTSV